MSSHRTWHKQAVAFLAAASVLCGAQEVRSQDTRAAEAVANTYVPNDDDFLLLQLRVKNRLMRQELRGYATGDGVCVDLGDMILALDLAVRLDKKSRRATGWLFSEDRTFTIDRDSNTVQIVNTSRLLQPGEVIDTPEGWCVNTASFAGWLDVDIKYDRFGSSLVLSSEQPLPFLQALERESRAARLRPERDRRDLGEYPQAPQPYSFWRLPSIDVVASSTYRNGGNSEGLTGRYEIFASGEAAKVSYDMRLASDQDARPESVRMSAFRKDPDGQLLGPLQATHVAAGDVEMLSGDLAGLSGVGRGAFIGNRSLQRPTRFGSTILRGTLPIGWDAELYRNGQLLALQQSTAEGRYEFEVNLVYGQNELEVVLYGPQGQIRRERQSVPIGYGALPAGKLEYWAGIVERNRELIEFNRQTSRLTYLETGLQYGAGFQYGLAGGTAVGASGHSLFLDGERRDYAEANLQSALGPMLVNFTAAQELTEGRAYRTDIIGKIGKLNIQGESIFTDGPFVSGLIDDNDKSSHRLQVDSLLKMGRMPMPVSGGLRRTQRRDGRNVNEIFARASMIAPKVSLTTFMLHRNTENEVTREDGTQLGLLANTRLAGFTIRGEGNYRVTGPEKGFDKLSLVVERPIDANSDLRLDVEHDAQENETSFELGYVRQFKHFALRGGAFFATDGIVGANLALNFSFGRDPLSGGVRFSREKLARRGHAAVSVFLDKNGDGMRSPDEEPLEGVDITAGQRGSDEPTDKLGHAFVEGLTPYEKVLVSIDESSLPDPFLIPVGKGQVITPRPGVPAIIEIAIAPTGEVEGVIVGFEGVPLAGVELELVDDQGETVARSMSEFDGFFLLDRVPYGTYDLRLAGKSAAVLDAEPLLRIGVTLRAGYTIDRLGNVHLTKPGVEPLRLVQPAETKPEEAASNEAPAQITSAPAREQAAEYRNAEVETPATPTTIDPIDETGKHTAQAETKTTSQNNAFVETARAPTAPAAASPLPLEDSAQTLPTAIAVADPVGASPEWTNSAAERPAVKSPVPPVTASAPSPAPVPAEGGRHADEIHENPADPAHSAQPEPHTAPDSKGVKDAEDYVVPQLTSAPGQPPLAISPQTETVPEKTAIISPPSGTAQGRASPQRRTGEAPAIAEREPAPVYAKGRATSAPQAAKGQADRATVDANAATDAELVKYDRVIQGERVPTNVPEGRKVSAPAIVGTWHPGLPGVILIAGIAIGGIILFGWRRRKRRRREED